jgi:hypothetical protein
MMNVADEFSKQALISLDFSSPKCYNEWVNKMKAFLHTGNAFFILPGSWRNLLRFSDEILPMS